MEDVGASPLQIPHVLDRDAPNKDEYFAAAYFGVSVSKLRRWRLFDDGPRYRKIGNAVRYSVADLDAWLANCPSGGSQAGTGGQQ